MARLPFHTDPPAGPGSTRPDTAPSDSAASAAAPPARNEPALTVSDVTRLVKMALNQHLPRRMRIVGEVSNFSDRTHWFFSLKDEQATLRCVCFATAARKVGFRLQDGLQVVATGRIDIYEAQGSVQFYVDGIEPVGAGALELRLKALMEELRREGYFEAIRKKPLPVFPQKVAIVTSRSGAALQDVLHTATRRWPGCRLHLMDVRVQGESAAPEIAAAIDRLSRFGPRLGIDAIILTRGGGSIEDLWAFNERLVADALFRCTLPVVAAIGHETDTTIAELVADVRCATPTQAAMTLIPDAQALRRQVDQLQSRLGFALRREWQQARSRLEAVSRHPFFRRPQALLEPPRQRLEQAATALQEALQRRLRQAQDRLQALQRHLAAVGPQSVLARGYSVTFDGEGRIVRAASQVQPGQRIETLTADGRFASTVEGGDEPGSAGDATAQPGDDQPTTPPTPTSAQTPAATPRRAPSRRSRQAQGPDRPQPGLFD